MYKKWVEIEIKSKITKIEQILAIGLFFNKKLSELNEITLVNSGIDDAFPFTRKIIEPIRNATKKTAEIIVIDNKVLFLLLSVIHIRYSVVKFM